METIKIKCGSCGGSGLYRGMAEPAGVAVVCLKCGGSGGQDFKYEPFTGRVTRSDVRTVRLSKGSFIMNCGPAGSSITYDSFLRGEMPKP